MPAAKDRSPRARRGTSTTPQTAPSTSAPRTKGATSSPGPKKAGAALKPTAKPATPPAGDASATSPRGPVGKAVQRDLEAIAERDPALAESGLAALALAMAEEIDFPNSATSKSMCAAQLREALASLRDLMPEAEIVDGVDDLSRRRAARLARAAGP